MRALDPRIRLGDAVRCLGVLAVVAVGACAHIETRPDDAPQVEQEVFSLQWTRRLMPRIVPYRDRANPFQGASPEVDPAGNRVFAGSADDHLYSLSATDGSVLWRRSVGAAIRSQPLYMHETRTIFVGTDDGELLAVGADDGEERWSYDAEAELRHQPVLDGEALYVAAADNSVHAVDWTTGEGLWAYRREPSHAEFEVSGFAGVAVEGRRVYTGFSDGAVVALDAFDGSVLWVHDLSEDIAQTSRLSGLPVLADVDTTPVLGERNLYVASYDAGVYALDREAGSLVWRQPLQGVVHIAAGPGSVLYLAQSGVGISAVDASSGRARWQRALGRTTFSRPLLYRDLLIVSDGRRGLLAIRAADGNVLQRFPVGSGASGAPVVHSGRAFVISNGGILASLSVR